MAIKIKTMDGNEAVATVAYQVTEASIIYPITPSSPMGELADFWASEQHPNLWGMVPSVVEMQSEAGAVAALHGALQTGTLATTYTASQGLLLMIPNIYKIAGELTPVVFHVASRSLACQALSIFGDHSDVMAVRATGCAMLCSSSVQAAHDLALIAHAATLKARIPFMHFFDGFRTSHEINKIALLEDKHMRAMIDDKLVAAHRDRALNPECPVVRGTSQNPDVYFQAREAVNSYYNEAPKIVAETMAKFAKLTGRKYDLVSYFGDKKADKVIVIMGSAFHTVCETIEYLAQKKHKKLACIAINLYRPFPSKYFLAKLPKTVKTIAVLDRTKEPGSEGEPLYKDVVTCLALANIKMPTVIGGRYGLSSKEFTPAMVKGIFDAMAKKNIKNHFTIGINDDVTKTSVKFAANFITESDENVRAIFYGLGSDGTVGANKNSIKIIGEEAGLHAQGYFVYDSKKSGSKTVSHLRFGKKPINSPYLIQAANFIGVHQFNYIYQLQVLKNAAKEAIFLLNSHYGAKEVWQKLPREMQDIIIKRQLKFYVIDGAKVAQGAGLGTRINTVLQTCFFALSNVLPKNVAIKHIKNYISKTYLKKGKDIVERNYKAVDEALTHLYQVEVPKQIAQNAKPIPLAVSKKAPQFVRYVTAQMMADQGDLLPVSALPIDGTYPIATTKWEKRNISLYVSGWDPESCIQCGRCSMVCPHAVIRAKRYNKELLKNAPKNFKSAPVKAQGFADERFTLQIYLEDCTGCALCNQTCPAKHKQKQGAKAINMVIKEPILQEERENIEFFESLPNVERSELNTDLSPNIQYLEPKFEFSGACAGCGETPYLKLISQLFGDHMLVANATGCTSIYGGNLPTTPWGCAWSNSLFEDNAEFGLGFKISVKQLQYQAITLLTELAKQLPMAQEIIKHINDQDDAGIKAQRDRVAALKAKLNSLNNPKDKQLKSLADYLIYRSVWIVGGDGWAYDIGYGGLDHVLASNNNVNVLVLDTEVYSNTGGQASKATPRAAVAKFAAAGKKTPAKDLGSMAMQYGYVYVAQISMGANPAHTLKAIKEAESYSGPSLIIAYSTCIAHGINMRLGLKQQELAVASGFWPLYRYNPELANEGKNPFILDSKPPSIPLQDYIYNETRFKSLLRTHPEEAAELLKQAQEDVNRRWEKYQYLAAQERS